MGVDFFTCDNCGETFNDCGDYAHCETCGQYLCPDCMRKYGVGHSMIMPNKDSEDDGYDPCPFCTKQIVNDKSLLEFALKELKTTREDLAKKYKEITA